MSEEYCIKRKKTILYLVELIERYIYMPCILFYYEVSALHIQNICRARVKLGCPSSQIRLGLIILTQIAQPIKTFVSAQRRPNWARIGMKEPQIIVVDKEKKHLCCNTISRKKVYKKRTELILSPDKLKFSLFFSFWTCDYTKDSRKINNNYFI